MTFTGSRLLNVRLTSLTQAIRSLGERLHPIEPLPRREVKRLLVGSAERHVGGLAPSFDGPEILALRVEHLNAGDGRDVKAVIAVDRHAVSAAFGARGNVAQLQERALVLDATVALYVVGEHRGIESVINDERLAVVGQRKAIGPRHGAVDQDRRLGAGGQVVYI